MAFEKIHIDRFLELAKTCLLIDVRSPSEYKHAHIPGAINLALFTDDERKTVGTCYKQQSRNSAIKVALNYFGPKMTNMVEEIEELVANRSMHSLSGVTNQDSRIICIYCWRGGMRSSAVAWLMDLYGFKVYVLTGGYKNFRHFVLNTFKLPFSFNILGGYTGSGKTELLKTLKKSGASVIDLEEIACHKGSAFGNIGMPEQPGQEMFENLLAEELQKLFDDSHVLSTGSATPNQQPPTATSIWVEDESQRIGLVNLPNDLWNTMRRSPVFFINIHFEERLKHLVQEYGMLDQQKLIAAIGRIKERLGGLNTKNAIEFLIDGNVTESFRILLSYYDKHYLKALHNRKDVNSLLHLIDCDLVTTENVDKLGLPIQYHTKNH